MWTQFKGRKRIIVEWNMSMWNISLCAFFENGLVLSYLKWKELTQPPSFIGRKNIIRFDCFFFSFHSTLLYTYIIHISSWASYREHVRICNNTFSKSHKLKAKTFEKKKHFRFADHRKCVRVFFSSTLHFIIPYICVRCMRVFGNGRGRKEKKMLE